MKRNDEIVAFDTSYRRFAVMTVVTAALLFLFTGSALFPVFAQKLNNYDLEKTPLTDKDLENVYSALKSNYISSIRLDFAQAMLDREIFLTDLAKGITHEYKKRQDEGRLKVNKKRSNGTGIDAEEFVSGGEVFADAEAKLNMIIKTWKDLKVVEIKARATDNKKAMKEIEKAKKNVLQSVSDEKRDAFFNFLENETFALLHTLIQESRTDPKKNKYDLDKVLTKEERKWLEQQVAGLDLSKEGPSIIGIWYKLEELESSAKSSGDQATMNQVNQIRQKLLASDVANRLIEVEKVKYHVDELNTEWEKLYYSDYGHSKKNMMDQKKVLIQNANAKELSRMFKSDTRVAFERYFRGEFGVAALEFELMSQLYGGRYTKLDDILFYAGESYFGSELYDVAEKYYTRLVKEYPSSGLVEDALYKLMVISYILNDRELVEENFDLFKQNATSPSGAGSRYYETIYLAGITYFATELHGRAIDVLEKIPEKSSLYFNAQYTIGCAYANLESYDNAATFFKKVYEADKNDEFTYWLKNYAALKLGFIAYDKNDDFDKLNAKPYFDFVHRDFEHFDAALMGTAWSYFKSNRIQKAKTYIDSLLDFEAESFLIFEAKTLLGHIFLLDPSLDNQERKLKSGAEYSFVSNSYTAKELSDRFISERDTLGSTISDVKKTQQRALLKRDMALVGKTEIEEQHLSDLKYNYFWFGNNKSSGLYYQEANRIASQLQELEELRKKAQEVGNKEVEEQIISLEHKMIFSIKEDGVLSDLSGVDAYFSKYLLSQLVSEIENSNRELAKIMTAIQSEKKEIAQTIEIVDNLMVDAEKKDNILAKEKLEYHKVKLVGNLRYLSEQEIWFASQESIPQYTELEKWGNFSNYGQNNVTFVLSKTKEENKDNLSRAIGDIDNILNQRRNTYEGEIFDLENELKIKEKQVLKKQLEEAQEQRELFFEQEFFDIKDTEKPEDDPYDYSDVESVLPDSVYESSRKAEVEDEDGEKGKKEDVVPVDSSGVDVPPDSAMTGDEGLMEDGTEDGGSEDGAEDGGSEDGTEDGGSEDGTEDGGSEDGTEDGGSEDGTEDGGSEDGAEDGGSEDGTEDGGSEDGTEDGGSEDGTEDGGSEDGTEDGGSEDGTEDGGSEDGTEDGGSEDGSGGDGSR